MNLVWKKLTKAEKLLFTAPLLFLAVPFAAVRGETLDTKLREMAGPNASDCGTVGDNFDKQIAAVDACVNRSQKAGKAFYFRQYLNSSRKLAFGFVGTSAGKFYQLGYDSPQWIPDFLRTVSFVKPFRPHKSSYKRTDKMNAWFYKWYGWEIHFSEIG